MTDTAERKRKLKALIMILIFSAIILLPIIYAVVKELPAKK
jgi:hypothetical protein